MTPNWVPIRYVSAPHVCDCCWETIPIGSPGHRAGERGTRAWWDKANDVWECLGCRDEATRAELAAQERGAP